MLDDRPASARLELDSVDLAKVGTHSVRAIKALGVALLVMALSLSVQSKLGVYAAPLIAAVGAYAQDIVFRMKRGWTAADDQSLRKNLSVAVGSLLAAYIPLAFDAETLPPFLAGLLPIAYDIIHRLATDNSEPKTQSSSLSSGANAAILLMILTVHGVARHASKYPIAFCRPAKVIGHREPNGLRLAAPPSVTPIDDQTQA